MNEDQKLAWLAAADQAMEGAKNVAMTVAAFWKELRAQGVDRTSASQITVSFVICMMGQAKNDS